MIWWLIFLAVAVTLAYLRASLRTAAIAFGGTILLYGSFGDSWTVFFVLALLHAGLFIPLLAPALRQEWLTRPALQMLRRMLPEISATEREALAAGSVWWDGELFGGRPDWHRLHALPTPRLSEEEQAFLDGPVAAFCALCDEWRITAIDRDLTPQAWEHLKAHRFFGMIIPREYGGLGFSALAHSAVLHKIASSPGGTTAASIVAVPNSLGPAELLLHYGTDAQKQHYLPRLARGEDIPCFALTSPWAGSDAGSIPDSGIVCRGTWQGREVLGLRLTFDKRYITLAPVATVVGLAFRMFDPDALLGPVRDLGITCALIPRDTPGLEIGKRHWPLDNPFMNGPVRGTDVFVPLDCIIGGAAMAGQGWRMLMECLAVGRSISLPSNTTGQASFAALATGAYARIRKQFNLPIGAFEAVAGELAAIAARTYAAQSVRQFTAHAVDLGEKPSVPSAIAKAWCTEASREVILRAMDVHGNKGVMLGPSNYLARAFQGTPIGITVEGANLLTRGMIIFGQGALRCHPYARAEIEAIAEPNVAVALERLDQLLWPHLGHVATSAARALVLGLSAGLLADAPVQGPTRRHYQRASRYAAALALLADLALASLGGSLKLREALSARLGEVLTQLYVVSATLKRHHDDGRPSEELPLIEAICAEAFVQAERALDGVLANLPARPLAWLARLLVFPLGRHARPADDRVQQRVAGLLQAPGPVRDRLAALVHRPAAGAAGVPLVQLEEALAQVLATEPLEKKVLQAARAGTLPTLHPLARIEAAREAGVLSADEAQQLYDAQQRVAAICRVDEFEPAELAPPATSRGEARKKKNLAGTGVADPAGE